MDKMRKLINKVLKKSNIDLGISDKKMKALKEIKEYSVYQEKIFGKKFKITHPFWFAHSIEEIFLSDIYQFESARKDPLIIDCGANWGLSIIYFKRLYPMARVIAFEADKKIFEILKDNIEEFQLPDVQLINMAVWNDDAEVEFSSEGSLGGRITSIGINTSNRMKVQSFRLKTLLEKNDDVSFLKIDIEGAEYEVLKDCKASLSNVKLLFVEYHSLYKTEQKLDEILEILKSSGFVYYIKEASNKLNHPFVDVPKDAFDMQLNIFAYRLP